MPLQPHGLESFIHPAEESAPLLVELEDPAESKMAFIAQNLNKTQGRSAMLNIRYLLHSGTCICTGWCTAESREASIARERRRRGRSIDLELGQAGLENRRSGRRARRSSSRGSSHSG